MSTDRASLFPDDTADAAKASAEGPFAAVAMETSIDRSLDYQVPKHLVTSLQVGQRVKVPLGRNNKPSHGYVVDIHDTTDYPKIKPLTAIDDPRVLVGPKLMALSR